MSEFELDLISTLVFQGESFAEADEEVRGLREAEFDYYDPDTDWSDIAGGSRSIS